MHRFGPFQFDSASRELRRDGEVVPLLPKVADTLLVLLERRGQIVSKSELMQAVWPDTVVEEVGLARNISLLRKEIGDEYLETIPKRGYRFVAAETVPTRRIGFGSQLVAAVGLMAVLVVYWQFYKPSRYVRELAGKASVAVVPFECSEACALADGFGSRMVEELVRRQSTQLVSPSTVSRYRQLRVPVAVMSRLLGLDAVVEGTAQNGRISIRLSDVHSGKLIWAEGYDVTSGNLEASAVAAAGEIGRSLNH